jgi:hypothetical protein
MFIIGNCKSNEYILYVDGSGFHISPSKQVRNILSNIYDNIQLVGDYLGKSEVCLRQSNTLVREDGSLASKFLSPLVVNDYVDEEEFTSYINGVETGKVYIVGVDGCDFKVLYFADYDIGYLLRGGDYFEVKTLLKGNEVAIIGWQGINNPYNGDVYVTVDKYKLIGLSKVSFEIIRDLSCKGANLSIKYISKDGLIDRESHMFKSHAYELKGLLSKANISDNEDTYFKVDKVANDYTISADEGKKLNIKVGANKIDSIVVG